MQRKINLNLSQSYSCFVCGFTLIELLIVVVILGLLAGVVVPQIAGSTEQAKLSVLDSNLSLLRRAIQHYQLEHGHLPGAVPSQGTCAVGVNTDTATGGAAAFVAHMTQYTTVTGVACSMSDKGSGGEIIFGPYFRDGIPQNPITKSNAVTAIHTGSLALTGSGTDENGGWLYDFITGQIIADQPSFDDR